MARLRDIKIGKTVWIKEGETKEEDFGMQGFTEEYIGRKTIITGIDEDNKECTVQTKFDIWFPVDWISLTPPDGVKGSPSKKKSSTKKLVDKTPEKQYIAVCASCTTEPGTLEEVVTTLRDANDYSDEDIRDYVTFYEVTPVKVKYTPSKFEVVE